MLQLVLRFVAAARSSGLRISTSEVLDAANHLTLIDPTDQETFRTVLRADFAKSAQDQARFDRLYHLFFKEMREDIKADSESLGENLVKALESIRENAADNSLLSAALDLVAGNPNAFLTALRELESDGDRPAMAMGANLGQLARRLKVMLAVKDIRGLLSQFLEGNRREISWTVRRDLEAHVNSRLELAQRLLLEEPRTRRSEAMQGLSYEKRLSAVGDKPFVSLSAREVEEMRAVVDQLVRRLKDTVARRYAARNRGILDVKKTLRRAARYDGVPVEIIRRKRPRRRGRIITLCDVSGSVWSAARFMLNMLYSVQDCFTKVRSFVFVAGLAEVTSIFEENEINVAIEKVLKETDLEYGAPTDYGATLRAFRREHMDGVNKKTTVIIIGDGRSNYCNPEGAILSEIRDRARRIIWLNPESELFWYQGDSEMRLYERLVNETRPCQNLNQLLSFIQDLVL